MPGHLTKQSNPKPHPEPQILNPETLNPKVEGFGDERSGHNPPFLCLLNRCKTHTEVETCGPVQRASRKQIAACLLPTDLFFLAGLSGNVA